MIQRTGKLRQLVGSCLSKGAVLFFLGNSLIGCSSEPANYPHGKVKASESVFFSSFSEQPKTLDPAVAYNADEMIFLGQVVEPPYQYAYLKRPYQLEPLTATALPETRFLDSRYQPLGSDVSSDKIAYTEYIIHIKPHIYYQPHPAFARQAGAAFFYQVGMPYLAKVKNWHDFKYLGTRELVAEDYVYQIKRLANPQLHSPLSGLLSEHIEGFQTLNTALKTAPSGKWLDLRQYRLKGVKAIDAYTYTIRVKGKWPALPYWLATPFFSPVPWEVDALYADPNLNQHNINFSTYPVGTGAYYLSENNPNARIILTENPYFHLAYYPGTSLTLPFIHQFIFTLEKESLPRWTKFTQGYYDSSGLSEDNFDQAIGRSRGGEPLLRGNLKKRGFHLKTSILPSIFYFGFNFSDPIVGGYSPQRRALRQAIAIAFDSQEYIDIFLNGRGKVAYSPIPPGIEGFDPGPQGINKHLASWKEGEIRPYSLDYAKKLLAKAGYPNGIDPKTGRPLVLRYDAIMGAGGDEQAQFQWMKKQFAKLGIVLHIEASDYNRFQDKAMRGSLQLFSWGWSADYPDPENFFFILYGGGEEHKPSIENPTAYHNPEFDRAYDIMRYLPPGTLRDQWIQKMIGIFQKDTPWFSIYYGETYQLTAPWIKPSPVNAMANNTLKYLRLDPNLRDRDQKAWNKPQWGGILTSFLCFIIFIGLLLVALIKQGRRLPLARDKRR